MPDTLLKAADESLDLYAAKVRLQEAAHRCVVKLEKAIENAGPDDTSFDAEVRVPFKGCLDKYEPLTLEQALVQEVDYKPEATLWSKPFLNKAWQLVRRTENLKWIDDLHCKFIRRLALPVGDKDRVELPPDGFGDGMFFTYNTMLKDCDGEPARPIGLRVRISHWQKERNQAKKDAIKKTATDRLADLGLKKPAAAAPAVAPAAAPAPAPAEAPASAPAPAPAPAASAPAAAPPPRPADNSGQKSTEDRAVEAYETHHNFPPGTHATLDQVIQSSAGVERWARSWKPYMADRSITPEQATSAGEPDNNRWEADRMADREAQRAEHKKAAAAQEANPSPPNKPHNWHVTSLGGAYPKKAAHPPPSQPNLIERMAQEAIDEVRAGGDNPFKILGLNGDYRAPLIHEEARRNILGAAEMSYKRLRIHLHPDRNNMPGAEDAFKKVQEAYEKVKKQVREIPTLPPAPSKEAREKFVWTVPAGVRGGDTLEIQSSGGFCNVNVMYGFKPGDRMEITLPARSSIINIRGAYFAPIVVPSVVGGLKLHLKWASASHYAGVRAYGDRFLAVGPRNVDLGKYDTALKAAIVYARHLANPRPTAPPVAPPVVPPVAPPVVPPVVPPVAQAVVPPVASQQVENCDEDEPPVASQEVEDCDAPKFAKGSRVEVAFNDKRWYAGTVQNWIILPQMKTYKYDVKFDTGLPLDPTSFPLERVIVAEGAPKPALPLGEPTPPLKLTEEALFNIIYKSGRTMCLRKLMEMYKPIISSEAKKAEFKKLLGEITTPPKPTKDGPLFISLNEGAMDKYAPRDEATKKRRAADHANLMETTESAKKAKLESDAPSA